MNAIDRRQLLRDALLLVGCATLIPMEALARPAQGAKRFFDPDHYAILDAVAETIIPRTDTPGARDAGVPGRFDAMMLTWASEARRTQFRQILDEMDAAARAKHNQGLAALSAEQQLSVVATYDHDKSADPQYMKFRALILTLYYLSEPGATQELRYEQTPGVWEPSVKVTPETRAWAV